MYERNVVARVEVRSAGIDMGLYRNVQTGAFIEVCPAAPAKPKFWASRLGVAHVGRAVGREMMSLANTFGEMGDTIARIVFKSVDL